MLDRLLLPLVLGKASGLSQLSTSQTSWLLPVLYVLSERLSGMPSSHCIRYHSAAALGKPTRSNWP